MLHQWYVDGAEITKASCSNTKTEIKWMAKKTSTEYKHLQFKEQSLLFIFSWRQTATRYMMKNAKARNRLQEMARRTKLKRKC